MNTEIERNSESTEFINDSNTAVRRVLSVLQNSTFGLEGIGDRDAPNLMVNSDPYWMTLKHVAGSSSRSGVCGRYITDVTKENLPACKKLMDELHIELRHLDRVKSNIVISDSELIMDLSPYHTTKPASRVLYSNMKEFLGQQRQFFETLWSIAIPASQRFKEIEDGIEPQRTNIIHGVEGAQKIGQKVAADVKEKLCVLADRTAPLLTFQNKIYDQHYREMAGRGVKILFATEITRDNLAYCKRMISEYGVELRHTDDSIRGYLSIADEKLFMASSKIETFDGYTQILYSNVANLAQQYQQLFESQWSRAVPAYERFREIEEGRARYRTRIIRDPEQVLSETKRMVEMSDRYNVSSVAGGLLYAENEMLDTFQTILKKHQRGEHRGIRWLTSIDESSKDTAKKFLEMGMNIRHLPTVPTESFGFSQDEVGVTVSRLEGGKLNANSMFSNDPMYVEHYASVFEELWETGVDASIRIKEMEEGIIESRMRIIRNKNKIESLYLEMVKEAKNEILLILPTTNTYLREVEIGVVDALCAATHHGVNVKMLAPDPFDDKSKKSVYPIEHKIIRQATTPNTVTVLVVDRTSSLIIEQQDDSKLDFAQAIGVATYSTRGSTVKANIRFFERMWEEVEDREREERLLEKERRSRKEAELLQDILAHDIRNYNQVSKTSAELLMDERGLSKEQKATLIQEIMNSINNTTNLIDRAKKLGRIYSQEKIELESVDVAESLQRSMNLMMKAYSEKTIDAKVSINEPIRALADNLIDEVFTNILSNSIKYTEDENVPIEITAEEEDDSEKKYWKISITDRGRGIPERLKSRVFTRYLESARGSGLGLSIVYALVVERYSGKLIVKGRVDGDHTKGTTIEIWLPQA